jgi:hypothetical protein
MLYLLDSSTLITANNKYYALDTVPEFWDWLAHKATSGQVKMPIEMLEEIKDGPKDGERDLLFAWIQVEANRKALLLDEDVDMVLVQQVVEKGYAPDLTDDEIDVIGRDPFLVAMLCQSPPTGASSRPRFRSPRRSGRTGNCRMYAAR